MSDVRTSVILSLIERHASVLIQFLGSLALARLLTPAEIGIFSVGLVVTGLVQGLRDFGIRNYIIQEADLSPARLRSALGVSTVISWAIATLLYALSEPIARFYAEPGLGDVILLLTFNFLVIPPGSIALALLSREMRFDSLLRVSLLGTVAQQSAAVTLALLGFGYLALAVSAVIGTAVTVVAAARLVGGRMPWRPSLRGALPILRFGGTAAASSIVTNLGLSAPDLVMGRMLGFAPVGLYSRAAGLVGLFRLSISGALSNVTMAAFAARNREGQAVADAYLRSVSVITSLAWPFYGFLGFAAEPLLRQLYGDQWTPATPLVQILCIAFAAEAITTFGGSTLLALGEVGRQLKAQLVLQPLRFLLVILASLHGVAAVAATQVLFYLLVLIVYQRVLHPMLGIRLAAVVRATRGSLLVALAALAPVTWVWSQGYLHRDASPATLALTGAAMAVTWLIAVLIVRPPIAAELWSLTARMRRRTAD